MIDYDRCVRAYLNLRQARSKLKEDYEYQDAQLKEKMEQIERAMQEALDTTGCESTNTEHGTVFFQTSTKASIADWSSFAPWVMENDALEFMQQRVNIKSVTSYLEEYGELPPGINVHRERKVVVRKKS